MTSRQPRFDIVQGWRHHDARSLIQGRVRRTGGEHFGITPRTVLVRFRFATLRPNGTERWHMSDILLNTPGVGSPADRDTLVSTIGRLLLSHTHEFQMEGRLNGSDWDADTVVQEAGSPAGRLQITEVRRLIGDRDLRVALGFPDAGERIQPTGRVPMFGHGGFRYLVEGMDVRTLGDLVQHLPPCECERMCVYRMLEDRQRVGQGPPPKIFRCENVNRWLNENGYPVGELTAGVCSDDIQAHAVHFRYAHCALDLTRSVINLYIPGERVRNHNLKSVVYVIVGDHCQPIVDANVIKSVMESARLGTRRVTNHASTVKSGVLETAAGTRKRNRSLDRVYPVQEDRGFTAQAQENGRASEQMVMRNMEQEDREEDLEQSVSQGTNNSRRRLYPFATDDAYFHLYNKDSEEGQRWIRERCLPTYSEPDPDPDQKCWHYYVCEDADDVEFLYEHLVRVLKIDPQRYARTYNGKCGTVEMQNTLWVAQRNLHEVRTLHRVLYPEERFRLCGLGSYAMRLLIRYLYLNIKGCSPLEAMSHYSPSLQGLMDNRRAGNRPKLLHTTFKPPFGPGPDFEPIIEYRKRADLTRSYASCVRSIFESGDEYPVHDSTNRVLPYSDDAHGHIPVGHYQVKIPDSIDPRFCGTMKAGEHRMMSHRMLRWMLDRGHCQKSDIVLACPAHEGRQAKVGKVLANGLHEIVKRLYCHPDLQAHPGVVKLTVNALVGICNGTTLPHSGMRYVFNDLDHCYRLLMQILSTDQLRQMRIWHCAGDHQTFDEQTVPFDYYELDSSGISYRAFHFQPVYTMVLEEQAMKLFDWTKAHIPMNRTIQMHLDSVEYESMAVQDVMSRNEYKELTNLILWENEVMGTMHEEEPKDRDHANSYYFDWSQPRVKGGPRDGNRFNLAAERTWDEEPTDPEEMRVQPVLDWKAALRYEGSGSRWDDANLSADTVRQYVADWYDGDPTDRSGLLVTGSAGSGKTFLMRQIYDYGTNTGHRVMRAAYTHSACVQMGPDSVTLSRLFGLDITSDVRSLLCLSHRFSAQLRHLQMDVLIVDEVSMIPMHLWECLMLLHRANTNIRIVLCGDFYQLPPVEVRSVYGDHRPNDFNYYDTTDILGYLLHDRAINGKPGQHWKMCICRRSDDPIMQRISADPLGVSKIGPEAMPMPPPGTSIYRFLCWRNSTRIALNWYCMFRWHHEHNPAESFVVNLENIYANHHAAVSNRHGIEVYRAQYRNMQHRPGHWKYLQDFTWAVGMECVCRNTLRGWQDPTQKTKDEGPTIVNNRRARITQYDPAGAGGRGIVYLQWLDRLESDDADLPLLMYHFAFNFVPGFAVTIHMSQGETISQHYGIVEYQQVARDPRMLYVALTRGTHSQLVHVVPDSFLHDPWGQNEASYAENLTGLLWLRFYHLTRFEFPYHPHRPPAVDIVHGDPSLSLSGIRDAVLKGGLKCPLCNLVSLVSTHPTTGSVSYTILRLAWSLPRPDVVVQAVCRSCHSNLRLKAVPSPTVSLDPVP